jgi:hypothetical protein
MNEHNPLCPYGENCLACKSTLKDWHVLEWVLHEADREQLEQLKQLIFQELSKPV